MVKRGFDSPSRLWPSLVGAFFYVLLFTPMTKALIAVIALTIGCWNPASAYIDPLEAQATHTCNERVRKGQIQNSAQYQQCIRTEKAVMDLLFGN